MVIFMNVILNNFIDLVPYIVVISILLFVSYIVVYLFFIYPKNSDDSSVDFSLDLSEDDLNLICRSISDSMNYDKTNYDEKFDLLFRLKSAIYDCKGGSDDE